MKTQKVYEIVLHVSSLSLTTVLDVVKDSATVKSLRQLEDIKKPISRYADGKRGKGISGAALVLEVLADGQIHTSDDLTAAFISRGFAANSVLPACSNLIADDKIKCVAHGRFCLASVTHIAAGGK